MAGAHTGKSVEQSLSLEQNSSPGQSKMTEKSASNTCLSEAEDYVDSIMSTQRVTKVQTPMTSNRKRHLSVSGTSDTTSKKARNCESGESGETEDRTKDLSSISSIIEDLSEKTRSPIKAKRTLYRKGSTSSSNNVAVTEADVHVNATPTIEQLIAKLSSAVHTMFVSMNERFDQLESGLEQRISSKVAQILDKRVNSELSKVRKDIDTRMETFKESMKAEMTADLADVRAKMNTRDSNSTTCNVSQAKDLSLNIVIRNLPESQNENTKNKVNALFRDGLRLSDITVDNAERKQTYSASKPGVVIARLKNKDDKQRVMKGKTRLRESRQFSKVYIHHDQLPSERSASTNFRAILRAMNNTNLSMKGSRIVYGRDDIDSATSDASVGNSERSETSRYSRHSDDRSSNNDWERVDYGRRGGRRGSRDSSRDYNSRDTYRWRD